jgi:NAD+ kinase
LKFITVSRGDEISNQITNEFHALAVQHGLIPDAEEPELIVSIGGDGTMLHAFHMYCHLLQSASFVGIHTGHLGFFADWMPEELPTLIAMIAHSSQDTRPKPKVVRYPLVNVEFMTSGGNESYLVLNEFTIKGADSTLVAELRINDDKIEMFRGDGICVSSPSGSTAYNKSLGGALIHPSLEAIQVTEIASINNRVYRTLGSPMILPSHHHCDIYPDKRALVLTMDHISTHRSDINSIRLKVADEKIQFVRYRPFPFWSRVREAFIGQEGDL